MQLRDCETTSLVDLYILHSRLVSPFALVDPSDDHCYYWNDEDPPTTSPGTILSQYFEIESCDGCKYRQAYDCVTDSLIDYWVPFGFTTPFYFRHEATGVCGYVTSGSPTDYNPTGTIITSPEGIDSCDDCDPCCIGTPTPDEINVTFSGVTIPGDSSCCLNSRTVEFTLNGTWTLQKVSCTRSGVIYAYTGSTVTQKYWGEPTCSVGTPTSETDTVTITVQLGIGASVGNISITAVTGVFSNGDYYAFFDHSSSGAYDLCEKTESSALSNSYASCGNIIGNLYKAGYNGTAVITPL